MQKLQLLIFTAKKAATKQSSDGSPEYIDEAVRQLNDRTNYCLLDSHPTDTFSQQYSTPFLLQILNLSDFITSRNCT